MGLSEEDAHCCVRFSLGNETSQEDIEYVAESLAEVVKNVSETVRFIACR